MPRESVKGKIIETATALFYEQGYHLTGIDQVIDEAGVARGSLYYHFESKTDLLLAYLDAYEESWYSSLANFLKPITSPAKKILALFDFRVKRQENMGFGGCAFIRINDEAGRTDERILQKIQENKDRLKEYIRGLVSKAGHRQLLTDEELVQMIYLLLEGGITSTSIYKNADDLKKAKKILSKFL